MEDTKKTFTITGYEYTDEDLCIPFEMEVEADPYEGREWLNIGDERLNIIAYMKNDYLSINDKHPRFMVEVWSDLQAEDVYFVDNIHLLSDLFKRLEPLVTLARKYEEQHKKDEDAANLLDALKYLR